MNYKQLFLAFPISLETSMTSAGLLLLAVGFGCSMFIGRPNFRYSLKRMQNEYSLKDTLQKSYVAKKFETTKNQSDEESRIIFDIFKVSLSTVNIIF